MPPVEKAWPRPPVMRIFKDEKIIDLFAGGGGVSTGIGWALGRDPDIAVNHNAEAIAMHAANHPSTKHYICDVFEVDPLEACGLKRPWSMAQTLSGKFKVGLFWMSPDCVYHSKARGGRPHRDRNKARRRRGLAGVGLRWARVIRPRVIAMENVEEFEEWGPLKWCKTKAGWVPDEERAGESFLKFVAELRNLGYDVEWRQLKACDFGAPTTRKRFYLLARCDGKPIVWPEPTHGAAPLPLPYRTAAECIDWNIPCPSIFMSKAEAKEWKQLTGLDVRRPLSDKTLRRIAAGVDRYILSCKNPFVVGKGAFVMPVNHGVSDFDGEGLGRSRSVDQPIGTVTAAPRGEYAVVTPFFSRVKTYGGGGNEPHSAEEPLRTVTASKRGEHVVVMPYLVRTAHGEEDASGKRRGKGDHSVGEPLPTQTASKDFALVAPVLVQTSWGEREGQRPRYLDIHQPVGTIMAEGIKHSVVEAKLHPVETAAFMAKHFGGEHADGTPKAGPGTDLRDPVGTVTTQDHNWVVAAHLVNLKGSMNDRQVAGAELTDPAPTICANGNHLAQVYAFMVKYYGTDQDPRLGEPMHTLTTKDRMAVVTVTIAGQQYAIVDICMRMLTPKELFAAMGFPPGYIIDPVVETEVKRGKKIVKVRKPLTKTAQVHMCGNAVCPPVAEALLAANFAECGDEELEAAA